MQSLFQTPCRVCAGSIDASINHTLAIQAADGFRIENETLLFPTLDVLLRALSLQTNSITYSEQIVNPNRIS
jgi:hypothetical protein